jgi:hypothetical protein
MSNPTITEARQEAARVNHRLVLRGESDPPPVETQRARRQPERNPAWWPTNHRWIPNYRQARYHPEWFELTEGSIIRTGVVVVLFAGCHLIAVCLDLRLDVEEGV